MIAGLRDSFQKNKDGIILIEGETRMAIFQTFEYNGRQLQLATHESGASPKPAKALPRRAPGAGKFEIGQIELSADKLAAGEELTLTAQVNGRNIAYIYSEILFQDQSLNQFYGPVAREYIQADRNKVTGGISRPDWDETINLTVRLSPSLRLLTDGVNSAFGFPGPKGYDSAGYWIDGQYTTAEGAASHRARITFDGAGEITDMVAYSERGRTAAPRALTLQQGDQFAPFVQILTPPTDEKPVWKAETGLSTPLTFHGQPFCWVTEPLMPGNYLVGLLVQDLDGGLTRRYSPLTISG
jgi:hypothetical protein